MRLARVRIDDSAPMLVAVEGDGSSGRRLSPPLQASPGDLVAALADERLAEAASGAPEMDLSAPGVSWLAPVEDPHVIVCAGQNFATHASESEVVSTPEIPSAFLRTSRSIAAHRGVVAYPQETSQLDYEVEVAAVIGRTTIDVGPDDAMEHVAGFCLAADLSAREIQFAEARAGSMLRGKNFPGTMPLGRWVTTADEIADLAAVEISLHVDGELRQHDSLASMVLAFPELISYWSILGLRPGDLVLSGTPAGVGIFRQPPDRYLLAPDQTVECRSPQLGILSFHIGERTSYSP